MQQRRQLGAGERRPVAEEARRPLAHRQRRTRADLLHLAELDTGEVDSLDAPDLCKSTPSLAAVAIASAITALVPIEMKLFNAGVMKA